jgi:uncharacterized protein (TIGR01244 family)
MIALTQLSASFSVTGPLTSGQMHAAAARGFGTIINFRPDGEAEDQLDGRTMGEHAKAAGLFYFHVPAAKYAIFDDELIEESIRALSAARGPVLATCASGQRAAILWGAIQARSFPVDDVLAVYDRVGLTFECLREEFEEQVARGSAGAATFVDPDFVSTEREAA